MYLAPSSFRYESVVPGNICAFYDGRNEEVVDVEVEFCGKIQPPHFGSQCVPRDLEACPACPGSLKM